MFRLGVLLGLLAIAIDVSAGSASLPPLGLQDQEGRRLNLGDLRGRIVIIVYGTRDGVDDHIVWGRRLDRALIARGTYAAADPPERRAVRILALAQMGGIPAAFRSLIRTVVRQHTPADFSLWLDWDDRMSADFGAGGPRSTVVVADRASRVQLVAREPASDAAVEHVVTAALELQ